MSLRTEVGSADAPSAVSSLRPGRDRGDAAATPTTFRPDIQGLRAVAVLMVILDHAGVPGMDGGFAGVDVFFVISGFLITGLLVREASAGGSVSLANFYARRARRILPAGTLVLLVTGAVALPLLGAVRAQQTVEDAVWAAFFAINWKLGHDGTDYFASALPPSPLQHYWSLAVEEQFYLVWPALIALSLLATRRSARGSVRTQQWASIVGVGAILVFGASLAWSIVSTGSNPSLAYFSTLTRAWELALGALVALLISRLGTVPGPVRAVVGWIGLVAVVGSLFVLGPATPFPGYAALLPVLGAAFVITAGVGQTRAGPSLVLGLRPLRWVGDRSYSLYLWHWPWLVVGGAYLGTAESSLAENAVLLVLALACAMLSYTFVELPFHKGWPRVPNLRFLALWPISLVLVLALAGLVQARTSHQGPTEPPGFGSPGDLGAGDVASPAVVDAAVAEAAAAASDGDDIPEGLAPPPTEAREDNWHLEGDCGLAASDATTSEPCVVGDPDGTRTMVLIGDSHAGHWIPSLVHIGKQRGFAVYPLIKYNCTAAEVTPWRSDLGGAQTDCVDWREWAFDQVERLRPDIVIMSSRTPPTIATEDGEEMDADSAVAAQEAGVAASIERLQGLANQVVVFSDTPTSKFDPVTCLDQPNHDLGDCAYAQDEKSQTATPGIEAAAARTGARFIDLTSWFCHNRLCPSVAAGMVVYFNPGHITRTYGLALAPYLEQRLGLSPNGGSPGSTAKSGA